MKSTSIARKPRQKRVTYKFVKPGRITGLEVLTTKSARVTGDAAINRLDLKFRTQRGVSVSVFHGVIQIEDRSQRIEPLKAIGGSRVVEHPACAVERAYKQALAFAKEVARS